MNNNKIINKLLTEPLNLLDHFQNVFQDTLPYKRDIFFINFCESCSGHVGPLKGLCASLHVTVHYPATGPS